VIGAAHFDHGPYAGHPLLVAIGFGIYGDLRARHRHHTPKNLTHIYVLLDPALFIAIRAST
jgi:hypothetical protein